MVLFIYNNTNIIHDMKKYQSVRGYIKFYSITDIDLAKE